MCIALSRSYFQNSAFLSVGRDMQMYKIITLGQSFIFINAKDPVNVNEGSIGKKIDQESAVITVSQSLKYDYSISISNNICVEDFDILRALMIYIYSVKGMPNAEYEVLFPIYEGIFSFSK